MDLWTCKITWVALWVGGAADARFALNTERPFRERRVRQCTAQAMAVCGQVLRPRQSRGQGFLRVHTSTVCREIEVVCAETQWCPACRKHFHSEGDADCLSRKSNSYADAVKSKEGGGGKGKVGGVRGKGRKDENEAVEGGVSRKKEEAPKEKGDESVKGKGSEERESQREEKREEEGTKDEVSQKEGKGKGEVEKEEGSRDGEEGSKAQEKGVSMDEDRTPLTREKRNTEDRTEEVDGKSDHDPEHGFVMKGNELVAHKDRNRPLELEGFASLSPSSGEEDRELENDVEGGGRARNSNLQVYDNEVYSSAHEETDLDSDFGVRTLHGLKEASQEGALGELLESGPERELDDFHSVGSHSLTPKSGDRRSSKEKIALSHLGAFPLKKQRANKKKSLSKGSTSKEATLMVKAGGEALPAKDKPAAKRGVKYPGGAARAMQTLTKEDKRKTY
ncbi:hypothetical protein CBR_g29352 [Chara braunii]|uniref:Uncharacterized protein n=1 Tax=Chara braunii TaxID=69332 RepID=A0A388JWK0_CHABU|nr:hypothetical protein CBR_g29352 [Chara braunii]|eukprot:GBG62153.1 hypothetical protein CBR_g29352 [Chara braunii]